MNVWGFDHCETGVFFCFLIFFFGRTFFRDNFLNCEPLAILVQSVKDSVFKAKEHSKFYFMSCGL